MLGERCLANFIAKLRYGSGNDMGFTCKEFLLPSQHKHFLEGRGLPETRQKCLLCSRYWMSYTYILARTDSTFQIPTSTHAQAFCNVAVDAVDTVQHSEIIQDAHTLPTHSSMVLCKDGYRQSAMLFVDENFTKMESQRNSSLSALCFKPVVRFSSSHYRYTKDENNRNRIIQVGIGMDENLDGLSFRQPPSESANPKAAKSKQAKLVV